MAPTASAEASAGIGVDALIEPLPEPTLVVAGDGGVKAANRAAALLLGTTVQELVGTRLHERVEASPGEVDDFIAAAGRSGTLVQASLTMRAQGPSSVECRVEGARVAGSADGTDLHLVLRMRPKREAYRQFSMLRERIDDLAREVERRAAAEHALRAKERALQEADRRKDRFLAMLAHELRNPLAPLANAVRMVHLAGDDPQVRGAACETLDRQLAQLRRLIDDLLDVSRIATDRLTLRREPTTLAAVVDSALETARPLIDAAGHRLHVDLPAEPLLVDGDLTRLSQALSNVLSNAAKYTARGGDIRLEARCDGGQLLLAVTDNGIGIARENLGRVFEMFSQLDTSIERSSNGLGVGLSVVRRLVEMHGGSLEVQSEGIGKGSRFTIRLPLLKSDRQGTLESVPPTSRQSTPRVSPRQRVRKASGREGSLPAPHGESPERSGQTPAASPRSASPLAGRRILVADDNRDNAESLGAVLHLMGAEVSIAYDGEQALQAAANFRPELAFIDIGMPRLSGYAVAERVRAQPWGREMTLIAVTGWGQDADRRRAYEAGFDRHLTKPIDSIDRVLAEIDGTPRTSLH